MDRLSLRVFVYLCTVLVFVYELLLVSEAVVKGETLPNTVKFGTRYNKFWSFAEFECCGFFYTLGFLLLAPSAYTNCVL